MLDPAQEKRRLRALAKASRGAIDPVQRAVAADALRDRLLADAPWRPGAVVAGYWPMGAEMDVRPLLGALAGAGWRCALPVVTARDKPLEFRTWSPGDRLVPGGFGTSVPSLDRPSAAPSLLLVPLLAFDARGFRLGYGGGYYDRTIAAMRADGDAVLAIGIAYAQQEMEAVPVEEFDQRLDGVATEHGYRGFGGSP